MGTKSQHPWGRGAQVLEEGGVSHCATGSTHEGKGRA